MENNLTKLLDIAFPYVTLSLGFPSKSRDPREKYATYEIAPREKVKRAILKLKKTNDFQRLSSEKWQCVLYLILQTFCFFSLEYFVLTVQRIVPSERSLIYGCTSLDSAVR